MSKITTNKEGDKIITLNREEVSQSKLEEILKMEGVFITVYIDGNSVPLLDRYMDKAVVDDDGTGEMGVAVIPHTWYNKVLMDEFKLEIPKL